jgi:hypothetical protein
LFPHFTPTSSLSSLVFEQPLWTAAFVCSSALGGEKILPMQKEEEN